jgi:2-C-methyl-D-erythritol 2,4-cyclodiphosphate synthase
LGGVEISFNKGLIGHSDADVLVHAVIDSLLGATGLGDIGRHFPDNDKKYRGISSLELLKTVCQLLSDNDFEVVNLDCIIIAQAPKLSDFIPKMKENFCEVLKMDNINIKATTEEGMGFTGNGEGISATAIALLYKNS